MNLSSNPHIIMSPNASRLLPKLAAVFLGLLLPAFGKDGGAKGGPLLRFICVSSLAEDQEVVLASRNDGGEWQEHGATTLRSSSITDWLPAKVGELHLAVRDDKGLKSVCHFTYPAGARHALVVLNANEGKDAYETRVVDPESEGFVKGSILTLNMSPITGLMRFGPDEHKVEAGRQLVVKPVLEDSGMFRLTASRLDAEGKPVLCHDRFVSGKPDSRGIVFLLPHPSRGLRVMSLPLLGSFD
jgi:hypothetical protein